MPGSSVDPVLIKLSELMDQTVGEMVLVKVALVDQLPLALGSISWLSVGPIPADDVEDATPSKLITLLPNISADANHPGQQRNIKHFLNFICIGRSGSGLTHSNISANLSFKDSKSRPELFSKLSVGSRYGPGSANLRSISCTRLEPKSLEFG